MKNDLAMELQERTKTQKLGKIFIKVILFIVKNILCLAFPPNISVIAKIFNWR